ncbi:MAG: hypothetical protein H0T78_00020 [Longispora sp.]|nr:hypothetical protein [Longispora sp. (in: high G+C Gram-positive bacteria)]
MRSSHVGSDSVCGIMRATVGPLPPAVYWRRRALVLGAILFVVLFIVYGCATSPEGNAESRSADQPEVKATSNPQPATNPFVPVSAPATGIPSGSPLPGTETACTDDQILVTARTDRDPVPRGAYLRIYLKVKNISVRTCTRDIGPNAQEATVTQNGHRIWSSDDCDTRHDLNIVSLDPNSDGQEFFIDWNTTTSSSATCSETRTLVSSGIYQAVVRFGSKASSPKNFKVN